MTAAYGAPRVDLSEKDAVLFDLDGVLTSTARLHATAWKQTFDELIDGWDAAHGTHSQPFAFPSDALAYTEGKPRVDGVRDFLVSRGIELPEGSPADPPGAQTLWGVGNRKQELVEDVLHQEGVEAFPGSVAWIRQLRSQGLHTGVVTSSRNCSRVLASAGIDRYVDARVDGRVARELGLPPKPAPDTFLEASKRLNVDPSRIVVVEDSVPGVQAGVAGGFGLVIAVEREGDPAQVAALRAAGAELVVDDLAELIDTSADAPHPLGPKEHRLAAAAGRLLAATAGEFPVEPFALVEGRYNPEYVPQTETLFALSNGYLGIRGTLEEGWPVYEPATLLNGFHETWPIVYPETAYGFATTGQTIVNVPDGTIVRLYVDDEPFDCEHRETEIFERVLDMRGGVVERTVVYRAADGRRFRVRSQRLVSLTNRHLAVIRYEVTALDAPAELTIASELVLHDDRDRADDDPRRGRTFAADSLELEDERIEGSTVVRCYRTKGSGLRMGCGMAHVLRAETSSPPECHDGGPRARATFRVSAQPGKAITLTKFLAYHHDRDVDAAELRYRTLDTLHRAEAEGYEKLAAAQRKDLDAFWHRSDVRTAGAPLLQQAIRYNLFQLHQATARVEGHGLPAKGLTGEGYEGHYFWDAEIYVLPFLVYTNPSVARSLLLHRYRMLPAARRRAAEVNQKGALFPWRTISGEEASAFYAAGTAQYHINADVAYALDLYVRITGDDDFLARYGAEILVETARLWADLGFFSSRKGGQFVIHGVTGPDEYSTVVDNNAYTNLMAQENLSVAARTVAWLAEERPADFTRLVERTGLTDDEVARWARAAERMYVPRDDSTGVLQDEDFLEREVWDFDGTPPDRYPLLLHYHPLVIYRHQVIKQADVVLATFLLGDRFTEEEKRRIFEYYDPLTTGDSSLSESIQAIVAAEIGDDQAAVEYATDAISVDLADANGNVRDGIHIASAGGSWMALVYGFAGLRDRGELLSFRPVLPPRMTRLAFSLRVRDALVGVDITEDATTYTLREGEALALRHDGEQIEVRPGRPAVCSGAREIVIEPSL